ncbi:MAG: hypothetical protein P4L57_10300 [Rhizomicrobium sp.]|nr:hypothetical protein [Rhizomicrobium sp.]
MTYNLVKTELRHFVRGGVKANGERNERLLSQLPLAYKNALFLWPNLEHHARSTGALIYACNELKKLGSVQLTNIKLPDRETICRIFPCTEGLSLDTHVRFALCLMAIRDDPRSPELFPPIYQMAREICGNNGFPKNAIEPCLYLAEMAAVRRYWNVLKDRGVKGIDTLQDFSYRLLEHINLENYDDVDCRAMLLEQLELDDIKTGMQNRASARSIQELELGFIRLANEAGIRPPSMDTLFKMLARWGKGNGKSTCALSPKSGNLVLRVQPA